jgi:hypothetical protein
MVMAAFSSRLERKLLRKRFWTAATKTAEDEAHAQFMIDPHGDEAHEIYKSKT